MNSRATELLPSESVQSDAEDTQDKGRRVARIQGGLASLGYNPGPADGILDPGTRARAVKKLMQLFDSSI